MPQPITLHSLALGPNPWKIAIVLEELGLPYHTKFWEFGELKQPVYEKVNINGRVPAIEDPNTSVTLWESGAIIEYLIDTYDQSGILSFGSQSPERFLASQWLFFQVSGQGPYFGQCGWFTHFHGEKVGSAIDRYANEIKRVVSILDKQLGQSKNGCLVAAKISYADLSFIPWNENIAFLLGDQAGSVFADHPHFERWHQGLISRPAVAKVLNDKVQACKQGSH